jgi:hypothetical protein
MYSIIIIIKIIIITTGISQGKAKAKINDTVIDKVNLNTIIIKANKENSNTSHTKQTPWPLVRERTIATERLPLVDEI